MPQGLENVSRFPDLFAELIRRGWSDANLTKLAGGNIVRALGGAESAAARIQKQRGASTATIEALDGKR
jgi:membrane dipeptidase